MRDGLYSRVGIDSRRDGIILVRATARRAPRARESHVFCGFPLGI